MLEGGIRRTAAILAAVSFVIVLANEICQALSRTDVIQYRAIFGHLTDFFLVPFAAGVVVALTGKGSWLVPAVAAALLSIIELVGRSDPWDVISYWLAAVAAYLVLRLSATGRAVPEPEAPPAPPAHPPAGPSP